MLPIAAIQTWRGRQPRLPRLPLEATLFRHYLGDHDNSKTILVPNDYEI